MNLIARWILVIPSSILWSLGWTYYQFQYYLVEKPRRRPPVPHRGVETQPTGLWAICAIYQRRRVSGNLMAYLTCLRNTGYNVIAVHNGPLDQSLIDVLKTVCHSVLVRTSEGRDFGSHKYGTAYLSSLGESNIKQVAYCNDSIFIRPSVLKKFLEVLRDLPDDYIGTTETYQFHYHIHSWFFAVSGNVFNSSLFQDFFRKYRPVSYRRHVIHRGEIRLTRRLVRSQIYPKVLFPADEVFEKVFAADEKQIISQLALLSNICTYDVVARILSGNSRSKNALLRAMSPDISAAGLPDYQLLFMLRRALADESALQNGMNLMNLLLLVNSDFPFLKKDLVYRDMFHTIQIEHATSHWCGEDAEHLSEIRGFFRSREAMRWQNIFHRVLAQAGVI
jgi:rhamnan synthesis protein F